MDHTPRRRDPGGAERDDDAAAPDALNGVGRNMLKMRCPRTLNGICVYNRLDDRLGAIVLKNSLLAILDFLGGLRGRYSKNQLGDQPICRLGSVRGP
jgi:hypothetical protein